MGSLAKNNFLATPYLTLFTDELTFALAFMR
jgi:hypothetical protein